MNEQKKNNGRGIFYGVIGVATLVVAIIGATFAYFTATGNDNTTIYGNMATISFTLNVTKVTRADEELGGMIPMSNTMVESAVHGTYPNAENNATKSDASATTGNYSSANICTDDNGNAICQVYKIVVQNTGSASMFVDGYVSLEEGSGTPADAGNVSSEGHYPTTMRWAQVFCNGTDNTLTSCTTAGTTTTNAGGINAWAALNGSHDTTGFYNAVIVTENNMSASTAPAVTVNSEVGSKNVTGTGTLSGNNYDIIQTNYIRISDHNPETPTYTRTADLTSALVFNQTLEPTHGSTITTASDSASNATAGRGDAKVLYIVVWLSENGHNQTAGATGAAESASRFFKGTVSFNSAQGSEVTATFSGYTAVQSDQVSP